MGRPGLEIPVFGGRAAHRAAELGASRIELNAAGSYPAGGLTPTLQDVEMAAAVLDVPVRVMIRPRGPPAATATATATVAGEATTVGRDFIYTESELAAMKDSIRAFRDAGRLSVERGDGFVFGVLAEEEEEEEVDDEPSSSPPPRRRRCHVDTERCRRLVAASRPFRAVFHRAFDEVVASDGDGDGDGDVAPAPEQQQEEEDDDDDEKRRRGSSPRRRPTATAWETGLADLAACGFDAVLTSGGPGSAVDNTAALGRIIRWADAAAAAAAAAAGEEKGEGGAGGGRGGKGGARGMEIIVGGGVRKDNVAGLLRALDLSGSGSGSAAAAARTAVRHVHSACLAGPGGTEEVDAGEVRGILDQLR
ncbi:hypothetical protein GGR56DRAFT_93824 [Xylariaceae sp. FL0804]|nr:hypothetical protein GGR56DRAFT_93824 [Xylariaceae sp. FL0804]